MHFQIQPIVQADALQIANWSYPFPYSLYDLSPDSIPALLNPEYRYHAAFDESGALVGYCCFGEDARVPGCNYSADEPGTLDIGLSLRPDLTGKGLGRSFIWAVVDFAGNNFSPLSFRVTVADFNRRSIRAFENAGFRVTRRLVQRNSGIAFLQLERPLKAQSEGDSKGE
jgi:RimJ/RimL family protein N-acetyltransferase